MFFSVFSLCLVGRVTGSEIPHETRVTHLGHNVTLPCDGSDQVVFQGGHASQLRRDGTNFVIIEAAPEDEGGILSSIMHVLTFIVQEHIIVTQTTHWWRKLIWYSKKMCHFRSQTLPSKTLKTTQILTTYGENNWPDRNNTVSYFLFRVLGISTAISIFALITLVSGIGLLLVKHRSHKKQVQHLKVS